MKSKRVISPIFRSALVLATILLASNPAQARDGYQVTLSSQLGTSGLSCSACHIGSNSEGTANTPIALTWKAGRNVAQTDSDGDGFINSQEVSGASVNFNYASITPYTVAGGNLANNVLVTGDNSAIEQPFTASNAGITVASGNQILGNVSVDIYTTPVNLLFKAGGAASTANVYVVDTYAQTNQKLLSTDWSAKANGSIDIVALPAGVNPPAKIVVERVIPVLPPAGTYAYGEDEEGCLTENNQLPLMLMMALLMISTVIRKDD